MKIKKFEDIIAWKKAQDLCVELYQKFKDLGNFTFRNQIFKATLSISNNIAEGFDRRSDKELRSFLFYALGSSSEVKSMLYLAERLNYISSEEKEIFIGKCTEISRLIRGFINSITK